MLGDIISEIYSRGYNLGDIISAIFILGEHQLCDDVGAQLG
jgi:hypothetical protein